MKKNRYLRLTEPQVLAAVQDYLKKKKMLPEGFVAVTHLYEQVDTDDLFIEDEDGNHLYDVVTVCELE